VRRAPLSPQTNHERENPSLPPPLPPEDHLPDLAQSLSTLQKGLDSDLKNGKLQLRLDARGLIISMREKGFFASGDDTVAPDSLPMLSKIAEVVQSLPNPVRLEGHTDARPFKSANYDNWRLSHARAQMALYMLVRGGLNESRIVRVEGHADREPKIPSDPKADQNRRVEILLQE